MLLALIPIFLTIFLGYVLNKNNFPGSSFWAPAEKLTYYVLFPALLIYKLAIAKLTGIPILPLAAALVSSLSLMSLGLLIVKPILGLNNPAFTSLFQGSIRPNTYVGLATAATLYADQGITLAAITLAIMIPMVNLWSVSVLTRFGDNNHSRWKDSLIPIVTNPLILACLVGITINLTGLNLPQGILKTLSVLGNAALPLGLLTVGAGLEIKSIKATIFPVSLASLLKLICLPGLTILTCHFFHVTDLTLTIAVLFTAIPVSVSSYILARQLGGDAKLMASILTTQTIISAFTLPITLMILESY